MKDTSQEEGYQAILSALETDWPDETFEHWPNDEDFLNQTLEARKQHGDWYFWSALELPDLHNKDADGAIALELWGRVLEVAQAITRARKLVAEQELAAKA